MIPRALVATLIAAATVAVYLPIRDHEFVHYDDFAYIVDNPRLSSSLPTAQLLRNLSAPALANWNPVTTLSFQIEHAVHGLSRGVHTTNLALHVLATLLLFLALDSLTGRLWQSGFVAAVFGLHPLHVESVAWASERKDVLCAVFWMTTLLAYASWQRRPSSIGRYLALAFSMGLALLAKPMAVTLPFVLLLLDVWPLARIDLAGGVMPALRRCVVEKLPLFALVAAIGVVTYLVQQDAGAVQELDRLSLATRLANAGVAYVAYLRDSVWPLGLAVFYPHVDPAAWWVAGCWVALLAVSAVVLRASTDRAYLAVGWFWFLGTLVPVIGLVQVGLQARADRYMYLPQIGVAIMLAWGAADLLGGRSRGRAVLAAAGISALAALGFVSHTQVGFWRDSTALFSRAVSAVPDNYFAHRGLADAHLRADRLELARDHYQLAAGTRPDWAIPQIGLADVMVRQGEIEAAIPRFERALTLDPTHPRAHTNLGLALLRLDRHAEATPHLESALQIYAAAGLLGGRGAAPHFGLARIAAARGDRDAEIEHYRAGLELSPGAASQHLDLGSALLGSGQLQAAEKHFELAARLGLESPGLSAGRGIVAEQSGRHREAIGFYRSALRERPDWVAITNNLAWLLATAPEPALRSPEEALDLASFAVDASETRDAGLLDTLAASHAASGDFEAAVAVATESVAIAQGLGNSGLLVELEAHLALYRAGRAYVQPRTGDN